MEKLKIELFRYREVVFGRVLEMDESLRGKGTLAKNDDFCIYSQSYPDLDVNTLYIMGSDRKMDSTSFGYVFETEDDAVKTCKNIRLLLNEINSKENKEIGTEVIRVL